MTLSPINSKLNSVETDPNSISRVQTTGDSGEYVILGDKKFYKHELVSVLSLADAEVSKPQYGDSVPLGLGAFSITTLILSLYFLQVKGIKTSNVVMGLAVFLGGVVQGLAGVWCFFTGDTLVFTVLVSFATFWFSFAAINIPSFGILAAYADEPEQLANAMGFYLLGWDILSLIFMLLTFKSTVFFCGLFVDLVVLFGVLAAAQFKGLETLTKVGGGVGVVAVFIALYNAYALMATKENSYFRVNVLPFSMFKRH
ncbi:Ammonia transport outward protein 2 [Candida viswanathii]|uniref:Ammonia transport outward protein 2 n=1 Tax=Candida viswanathii TaxID=5486 RepID=A0A367YMJ1_9ASCO|nr:Ammonia transport outward protein 2 [Candida viswanathii]